MVRAPSQISHSDQQVCEPRQNYEKFSHFFSLSKLGTRQKSETHSYCSFKQLEIGAIAHSLLDKTEILLANNKRHTRYLCHGSGVSTLVHKV